MKKHFRLLAILAGISIAASATALANASPPAKLDTSPQAAEKFIKEADTGQAITIANAVNYDKIVADQAIAEPRELDTSPPAVAILANKIVDTTPAASQQGNYARIEELDTSPPHTTVALVSNSLGADSPGIDSGQVNATFSGYRTLVRSA